MANKLRKELDVYVESEEAWIALNHVKIANARTFIELSRDEIRAAYKYLRSLEKSERTLAKSKKKGE